MKISNVRLAAQLQHELARAAASHERTQRCLAEVSETLEKSRHAVNSSRALLRSLCDPHPAASFSVRNGCGTQLAFSLGATSVTKLAEIDRDAVECVCERLDTVAVAEGDREARQRFDVILIAFAIAEGRLVLH